MMYGKLVNGIPVVEGDLRGHRQKAVVILTGIRPLRQSIFIF